MLCGCDFMFKWVNSQQLPCEITFTLCVIPTMIRWKMLKLTASVKKTKTKRSEFFFTSPQLLNVRQYCKQTAKQSHVFLSVTEVAKIYSRNYQAPSTKQDYYCSINTRQNGGKKVKTWRFNIRKASDPCLILHATCEGFCYPSHYLMQI